MNNFDRYIEEKTRAKEILLIEHDIDVTKAFYFFSKKYNCILTTAQTGQLGIELVNKHKFDTVFLDLNLPCMPGIEVFRQIKNRCEKCNKVPVAIISDNLSLDLIQKIHEIGFAVFVLKPKIYDEEFFDSLFCIFGIKKLPQQ